MVLAYFFFAHLHSSVALELPRIVAVGWTDHLV